MNDSPESKAPARSMGLSMDRIAGWVKRWVDSLFLRKTGRQKFTGTLTAITPSASQSAIIVQGAPSQTAALQEWRNSSGALSVGIWNDASIRVSSIMRLRVASGASIANDGTLDTGLGYGLVFVYSSTLGRGALFRVDVDGSTLISGSSSHFTGTADTASRVNVYYSGSTIKVQNKNATSRNVRVWMMTA